MSIACPPDSGVHLTTALECAGALEAGAILEAVGRKTMAGRVLRRLAEAHGCF